MKILAAVALLLIACACPFLDALAQPYPSKPITLVVPYGPGGGADIVARTVSPHLSRGLQQQIVVENRPGAGGSVGAAVVARAAPDGYTLMLGTNTHALNATLQKKLAYDFASDFAAVGQLSAFPYVLVVHPSLPVASLKGLVALARRNPGELLHSSSGNGSTPHLTAEMFKTAARITMIHVPYRGATEALTDLIAGRVQLGFASISSALPHLKSNRLRALAVTSARRPAALPDAPTMIESGFANMEVNTWNAIFAPAKTPAAVIGRIHAEIMKTLAQPEVRERFAAIGVEPVSRSPQELERYVTEELARWARVVRESGATIE